MFENFINIFKKSKKNKSLSTSSKNTAKERLHLVLMQDRANVSADFLDLMRKEIIEVIKKYIDIDEKAMDVRLTNETNDDGTQGAPALYANIPIINIKDETRKLSRTNQEHKIEIKLTEKSKKINEDEKNSENVEKNSEKKEDDNNLKTEDKNEETAAHNEDSKESEDLTVDKSELNDKNESTEETSENKEEKEKNNEE